MSVLAIPRIIAHRGAKAAAPENTLAAMRRAHAEGASWVEFDVKLTHDGVPVVIHDETLERTTNGRGRVADLTLDQIRRFDAGRWFSPAFVGERVPTLSETLALLASLGMGFNLEIKPCPGRAVETAEAALKMVEAEWPADKPTPVISSFNRDSLKAARRVAPDLPRGYLAEALGRRWQEEVRSLACRTLHPGWRRLTRAQVKAAKAAGWPVLVWTVNEPARARELIGWGVDGLITDRPEALIAALRLA